jgi:hypothetical protein
MARLLLGLGVIGIRADPAGLFVIAIVVAIVAGVAVVSVEVAVVSVEAALVSVGVAVGTIAACRVHELIGALVHCMNGRMNGIMNGLIHSEAGQGDEEEATH